MADTTELLCLLYGDDFDDCFSVEIKRSSTIASLKNSIKATKENALRGVDVSSLSIWPVLIPYGDHNALNKFNPTEERAKGIFPLIPVLAVSETFPSRPARMHIHVIVQHPSQPSDDTEVGKSNFRVTKYSPKSPPLIPPSNSCMRSNTVSALYEKLIEYGFIHVRGTPGSGKTTLAELLALYISERDASMHIIWVDGWPVEEVRKFGGWYSYLVVRMGWQETQKTVFIFDEAQLLYEEGELWRRLFKNIHAFEDRYAIAFSSYGSPTSPMSIQGTPIFLMAKQRVTLRPIQHDDGFPAVGLFFSRLEFDDLISKQYSSHHFHLSFLDYVFEVTQGHVGAILDFIKIIMADDSYRQLRYHPMQLYTLDLFSKEIGPRDLITRLSSGSIFTRGLPRNRDLQVPAIANVFSTILCECSLMVTEPTTKEPEQCFRNGWLHSDELPGSDRAAYFFPTLLHRWYMEWKLFDTLPSKPVDAINILAFVMEVIRNFSSSLLSETRRIGPGCIQQLPEAQYQDEFYRCCYKSLKGSLVTFPEFGTGKGRVDFYIPSKKWGVELLCNGDKLAQHSGRFSQIGSYQTNLTLDDYVILDCCQTCPIKPHPGKCIHSLVIDLLTQPCLISDLPNLYHVLFSNNFKNVQILDGRDLKQVPDGEFMLLASS